MTASRGVAESVRWHAQCKDCGRLGAAADFVYPDAWIEGVLERGGKESNRCPACRQAHERDARTMAMPYIDLNVIGEVADPEHPQGPLGALGPLPVVHKREPVSSDLSEFDFGLGDDDVLRLLAGLEQKQVAVVVAGTGSGKSTFLPYRLLVPPEGAALRLADAGTIVMTEPRVFATMDVATFIATRLHRSDTVGPGSDIGYRVKGRPAYDAACRLLVVTDGSLINWLRDGSLDRFSAVLIDEAHERSKNIDVILAVLRAELPKRRNLRVIVLSATIDAAFFAEFFGGERNVVVLDDIVVSKRFGYGNPLWPDGVDFDHADWGAGKLAPDDEPLIDITRRLADLRVLVDRSIAPTAWPAQMPGLVAEQALALARRTEWGDILGFLPGQQVIATAVEAIRAGLVAAGIDDQWDVYSLLRSTPEDEQLAARSERRPGDKRRIVISTNIAETSLTIDGATFVIDSGLIHQSAWDPETATKSVPPVRHSKDGVRQRWGRVGRKAPGWVFPLYDRKQFEALADHTPPEAVRDDLESLVLVAKAAGVDDPREYVWPAAFRRSSEKEGAPEEAQRAAFSAELERATRALHARGALDTVGDLTPWGRELLGSGGTPSEAGAMAGADDLACAVECATVLSMLTFGTLRGPSGILRFDSRAEVTARHAAAVRHAVFFDGAIDDVDVALRIFGTWERAADPAAWAARNCVDHEQLVGVREKRDERLEFLSPGRGAPVDQPVRIELASRLRAVFARAYVDQAYVQGAGGWLPEDGSFDKPLPIATSSTVGDVERVVSLRRIATARGTFLAGIVAAPDWAIGSPSWLELTRTVADRERGPDGRLIYDTSLDSLLRWHTDWTIGAVYRAVVDADGRLTHAMQIAPPPIDPLADRTEDADGDEAGGDDDAQSDAGAGVEVGAARASSTDLVSALERSVTTLLSPESETAYLDLADVEADDDEEDAASAPSDAPGVPALRPTYPPIALQRGVQVPAGEWNLRVTGFAPGQQTVLVVPFSDEPGARLTPGREMSVVSLGGIEGNGRPYAYAVDVNTGWEICLHPRELSLNAFASHAADDWPFATNVDVHILETAESRTAASASRIPQLQRDLAARRVALADGDDRLVVRGVLGETTAAYVPIMVGDDAASPVHRFSIKRQSLEKSRVGLTPGLELYAQLAPSAAKDGWIVRQVPVLADGCETIDIPGVFGADRGSRRMLRAAAGMSSAVRDALAAQSSAPAWVRAVETLYAVSNGLDAGPPWIGKAISAAPAGLAAACTPGLIEFEPGRPAMLSVRPGADAELFDRLLELEETDYWQNLVTALRNESMAADSAPWVSRNSTLLPAGLENFIGFDLTVAPPVARTLMVSAACRPEEVEALARLDSGLVWRSTIENVVKQLGRPPVAPSGRDGRAQVELHVAAPALPDPLPAGIEFVELRMPSVRAAALMPLELCDRLIELSDDDAWRNMVRRLWRETNELFVARVATSSDPPPRTLRGAELAAALPVGLEVEGTVVEVKPFGTIVQLDGLTLTAMLHKSQTGDPPISDPTTIFAVGDRVRATVDTVESEDGRDRVNLRISGRDLELEVFVARVPEGSSVTSVVSTVTDYGAFIPVGGRDGLLHKSRIGAQGVGNPGDVLTKEDAITVKVERIKRGKRGLEIELSARDVATPSRLDQMRSAYPVGSRQAGTVTDVVRFGVFVELARGTRGLIPERFIGAAERARITPGARIEVQVVDVRDGARRVEITLRLV